ncbi:N66 matrix protein-like [Leptopilina boulardi]|uniref:N66 matrix protein-like n=1 Tax=Leptopilina boulardi TaxID=63433 RepID=UPI0021F56A04|nr:N66 matrix protein-like [Leptopilina boulardi]
MASIKCLMLVFILLLVDHSFALPVRGDTEGNKDNKQDESTGGCGNHTENVNNGGNVNCRGNINCLENLNNETSINNVANGINVIYETNGGSSINVDNGNIGGNETQFRQQIVSNFKTYRYHLNNGNQGRNRGYGNYGGWSNNGGSGNNVGNKNNIKYVNNGGASNNVGNSNIGGHNYQHRGNIVSNTNAFAIDGYNRNSGYNGYNYRYENNGEFGNFGGNVNCRGNGNCTELRNNSGNFVSNANRNAQATSWWNGSSEWNFKADQGHESSASASASS